MRKIRDKKALVTGAAGGIGRAIALRLASEGVDLARLSAIGGRVPDEARVAALAHDGLIARNGNRLAATQDGRLVLDRLIADLAA